MTTTTISPSQTRASLDIVVRVRPVAAITYHDNDYLPGEWGLMPDDGDDLRVLMIPRDTDDAEIVRIERLLDSDPSVAAWCPLVDPGEVLDDAAWASAIGIVR